MEAVADRSALKTRLAILHQTKPKTLELKAEIFEVQRALKRSRPKPPEPDPPKARPRAAVPRPPVVPPPPVRTDRDRIQILQRHLAYLEHKAEQADATDPYRPWVVEEAKALKWALSIFRNEV